MSLMAIVSALLVLVSVGRLHDAFARYTGAIPAAKILLALGAIAFLLNPGSDRLAEARRTIQGKAFAVFVFSVLFSVPFSYHRSASLEFAILFMTTSVPIVLILLSSIVTIADMERLMRSAVLMVVAAACIIAAGFGTVIDTPEGPRISLAGSYDVNDLGMVISASMAFCLWAIKDRMIFWRLMGYAGLVGGAFVVVNTGSRGGALALGSLILLATFTVKNAVPRWFRAAIVPLAMVGYFAAPAGYRQRIATIGHTEDDYNTQAESGRIKIWKRGFTYFLDRPLNGVGVAQFYQAEGRWGEQHGFTHGWKWSAPHNMYIESAAELGIMGIGGLLCVLIPTLRRSWSVMRSDPERGADPGRIRVAGAMFLAISTFMVGSMFLTAALGPMFCFLAALSISFQSLSSTVTVRQGRPTRLFKTAAPAGAGIRRATRWTGRRPAASFADRST